MQAPFMLGQLRDCLGKQHKGANLSRIPTCSQRLPAVFAASSVSMQFGPHWSNGKYDWAAWLPRRMLPLRTARSVQLPPILHGSQANAAQYMTGPLALQAGPPCIQSMQTPTFKVSTRDELDAGAPSCLDMAQKVGRGQELQPDEGQMQLGLWRTHIVLCKGWWKAV